MALFGRSKAGEDDRGPTITQIQDPQWVRDDKGRFRYLMELDTVQAGLHGIGGVYAIWHGGIHPQWVYIGYSEDLGSALDADKANDDITQFEVNGRLFVTWSPVRDAFRLGVAVFLVEALNPLIDNEEVTNAVARGVREIPVRVPGAPT